MASSTPAPASTEVQTMRAWVYKTASQGLEKNLELREDVKAPQQQLDKDDIVIKIHSMSINPADHKVPEFGIVARAVITFPGTPGMDYAGTVAATGSAVERFRVGDHVFGKYIGHGTGTLAEYIKVAAPYVGCAPLPEGISFDDAACLGTGALTAYQALNGHVEKGDEVFINGGSGGVGTFAIQLAKHVWGCRVTASCSGPNVALCKELGADDVIDYTKENVSETLKLRGQVFKHVLDTVCDFPPDLYKAADVYMLPHGRFVQIGGSITHIGTLLSRVMIPWFLGGGHRKWEFCANKPNSEHLVEIGDWMKEGKLKAVIERTFSFEDAPKAYAKLKTGRTKGKLVIRVATE